MKSAIDFELALPIREAEVERARTIYRAGDLNKVNELLEPLGLQLMLGQVFSEPVVVDEITGETPIPEAMLVPDSIVITRMRA